ncbi:hypothetical protein S40293_10015 [Stachybotrys chartarum IBT 40293]|nr:hypothetical protein S40293_10015 [Stachybotrys chartarum IBT 40293]
MDGPQDWSDFVTNLAPIIVFFGEQASKQFLSESTSVFGRPLIVEFFHIKGAGSFCPYFEHRVNTTAKRRGRWRRGVPNTCWNEINNTISTPSLLNHANVQERGKIKTFAPYPNLCLNIGIKPVPLRILRMTAGLGALLQSSFVGYATWATFYYPDLYDGENLPTLWSFCLGISGTMMLVIGMVCCAMLIEKMSVERRFRDETRSPNTTMFWLQPGNQRVGDQLFNAFAYSESKKTFITSWKVELEDGPEGLGNAHSIKPSLHLWTAIGLSFIGFVCQFLGLRGLHGSFALYQLGVTPCMAIIRAFLRSGWLGADNNKLKQRKDIEGHELDWQAMNLEKPEEEFAGGWYIDDLPWPLERPKDSSGPKQEKPDTAANEASLAYLTGNAVQASEQRWNTEVRATAKHLQGAMQEAAEYIFSEMGSLKGWRESRSLIWSTTCHLHESPTLPSADDVSDEGRRSQPIHTAMYHNRGLWEISECQLEAALGLWYWSVSHLPGTGHSSQRKLKVFMVERCGRKNALDSAIRLWVTQTRHVLSTSVKLPWSAALQADSQSFCQVYASGHSRPNGAPQSSPDEESPHYYPTTLSVPLMTMLGLSVASQVSSSHIIETQPRFRDEPTACTDLFDGVALSTSTESSLLQLVAQDLFGIFISRIADILEPLDIAEPWTRHGQTSTFGMGDASVDQSCLGLTNSHIRALANIFVSSGIGSREDALMTIVPPLLQRSKLPETSEVLESLLRTAKMLRRSNKFTQGENLFRWLIDNVPQTFQERAIRGLGELYRKAVRSADPVDRHFGRVGFVAMQAMEVLSEGQQLFEESKQTIQSYLLAWETLRETGRRVKKSLGPLVDTLNGSPTRPLGLYIADKYDLDAATSGDILSVLKWAIEVKCPELIEGWDSTVVELLLDHRANPNSTWHPRGVTPLGLAAEVGDVGSVGMLMRHGADPKALDSQGGPPLLIAMKQKDDAMARLMIEGVSLSKMSELLCVAVSLRNKKTVDLVLSHEVNTDFKDDMGQSPLLIAVEEGLEDIAERLLEAKADVNDWQTPLALAVEQCQQDTVMLLLQRNANPNAEYKNCGNNSSTVLHLATTRCSPEIVELLLAARAELEAKDYMGRTLLLQALEMDTSKHNRANESIVSSLLRAGADLNVAQRPAEGSGGGSALHLAVETNNSRIVKLLIRHGANTESRDIKGRIPLIAALDGRPRQSREQTGIVRQLLTAGANPHANGGECGSAPRAGRYCTSAAVSWIRRECPRRPLRKRTASSSNSMGWGRGGATATRGRARSHGTRRRARQPAPRRAFPGRKGILEMLLRHGTDTEVEDAAGLTPLLVAVSRGHVDAASMLLSYRAKTESTDKVGRTALLIATSADNEKFVKVLLDHGADKEAKDTKARTPLLVASEKGYNNIVKLLLDAGANVKAEGGIYGSSMRAALYRGDTQLLSMLEKLVG